MFILSELEDKVRIEPAELGRPTIDAVTAVIEQLYLDKASLYSFPFPVGALKGDAHLPSDISAPLVSHDLTVVDRL
jgi:hypothetical protein